MPDHELPYIFPDRDIVNSDAWNGTLERMGLDFYGYPEKPMPAVVTDEYGGSCIHGVIEIFPYYWGDDDKLIQRSNLIIHKEDGTDFVLNWYKYPFRAALMSQDLDKTQMIALLEDALDRISDC